MTSAGTQQWEQGLRNPEAFGQWEVGQMLIFTLRTCVAPLLLVGQRCEVRRQRSPFSDSYGRDCCLFAKCSSRLLIIIPTRPRAVRCVDSVHLDLNSGGNRQLSETISGRVIASGRTVEAARRLVSSAGLRCERRSLTLPLLSSRLRVIDGHFSRSRPPPPRFPSCQRSPTARIY